MSFSNYDILDIKTSRSHVYDFFDIENELNSVEGRKTDQIVQGKDLKYVLDAIDDDCQRNV